MTSVKQTKPLKAINDFYLSAEEPVSIVVEDLGTVTLSKNSNGLQIYVADRCNNKNTVASFEVVQEAFSADYSKALRTCIQGYDKKALIPLEFCHVAYKNGTSIEHATETWFGEYDVDALQSASGQWNLLDKDDLVLGGARLKISESSFRKLHSQQSKFFITNGGRVVSPVAMESQFYLQTVVDDAQASAIISGSLIDILFAKQSFPIGLAKVFERIGAENITNTEEYSCIKIDAHHTSPELGSSISKTMSSLINFYWGKKEIRVVLCSDEGRGLNERVEIPVEGGEIHTLVDMALASRQTNPFSLLVNAQPMAYIYLLAALKKVSDTLGVTSETLPVKSVFGRRKRAG